MNMQSCPTITQVPAMLVMIEKKKKKKLAPQVSAWESLGYYTRVS
jgi:hypothetical protein